MIYHSNMLSRYHSHWCASQERVIYHVLLLHLTEPRCAALRGQICLHHGVHIQGFMGELCSSELGLQPAVRPMHTIHFPLAFLHTCICILLLQHQN